MLDFAGAVCVQKKRDYISIVKHCLSYSSERLISCHSRFWIEVKMYFPPRWPDLNPLDSKMWNVANSFCQRTRVFQVDFPIYWLDLNPFDFEIYWVTWITNFKAKNLLPPLLAGPKPSWTQDTRYILSNLILQGFNRSNDVTDSLSRFKPCWF